MVLKKSLFCLVLFFLPHAASASITINEIAWMGSVDSANDEWIELFNDGQDMVSVDGWLLEDGQSLSIELSGSIEGGEYVVLERTDDGSAPGTAFLIYTGALANTGATLRLKDRNGSIIDQVAGEENWEAIGGDNVTKETAQYSENGWITAAPTPGYPNASVGSNPESNVSSRSGTSGGGPVKSKPRPKSVGLAPSTATMQLAIETPSTLYVNNPAVFSAAPAGIGETILNSLKFEWNFGDLETAKGKKVEHVYTHPGEYVLTLRAYYSRHDELIQVPIMVLPVRFSLTQNSQGDVLVHNNSPYVVDISGYSLLGTDKLVFPDRSFIAQNGTIVVQLEKIDGLRNGQAYLHDQQGQMISVLETKTYKQDQPVSVQSITRKQANDQVNDFAFVTEIASTSDDAKGEKLLNNNSAEEPELAASVVTAPRIPKDGWPMIGLVGVMALALFGVLFGSQKS